MIIDHDLRAALHRLAPEVVEDGVWEALHLQRKRRPRKRLLVPVAVGVAVVACIVAALLALGLVGPRDQDQIVYILDSPGVQATMVPGSDVPNIVWPQGQDWGLWAGNVEVLPESTMHLPPEFYTGPATPATAPDLPQYLRDAGMSFKPPSEIEKPLWVFADEVDIDQVADEISAAREAGRPVLVVNVQSNAAAAALGVDIEGNVREGDVFRGQEAAPNLVVAWIPWREYPLSLGPITPRGYWASPDVTIPANPDPETVYAFLAPATLYDRTQPVEIDSETARRRALETGQYFGFWAGNVDTIPERPKDLPDFFFSGPTPLPPTGSINPEAYVDPTTIKTPLWVFGSEVDLTSPTITGQIRQAKADGRPVVFYATPQNLASEALGIESGGSSYAPLERQIFAWLPWLENWIMASWDGDLTPDVIFRMLTSVTLQPPLPAEG